MFGRRTIGADSAVGIRHSQKGLLYCAIQQIPVAQFDPWRQRAAVLLLQYIGPAKAEQCLVGMQAVEPHSTESLPGRAAPFTLQPGKTKRQVRLVAECRKFGIVGLELSDTLQ